MNKATIPSNVTISREAYAALVKEAHDADCLKSLIEERYKNYGVISREDLKLLYALYFVIEDEEGAE